MWEIQLSEPYSFTQWKVLSDIEHLTSCVFFTIVGLEEGALVGLRCVGRRVATLVGTLVAERIKDNEEQMYQRWENITQESQED